MEQTVVGGSTPEHHVKRFNTGTFRGKLAIAAATVGSIIFGAGCEDKKQAGPPVPRPTFSTLTENQQRNLSDVPAAAAIRKEMKASVDGVAPALAALAAIDTKDVAAWFRANEAAVKDADAKLAYLRKTLDKALSSTEFSPQAQAQFKAIQEGSATIQKALAEKRWEQTDAAACSTVKAKVTDTALALDWDLKQLAPGLAAPQLVAAQQTFLNAQRAFQEYDKGITEKGIYYFTANAANLATVRETTSTLSGYVGGLKGNPTFTNISDELGLLQSSLSDLSTALSGDLTTYWSTTSAAQPSGGQLLVRQVERHLGALQQDFRDELSTIGIQSRAPSAVENGPAPTPQTIVVRENNMGSTLMWWYLLTHGDRHYHNSYYVPPAGYHYSGTSRLHSSAPYTSFVQVTDQSFGANSNKPGLSNTAGKRQVEAAQARARAQAEAARQAAARSSSSGSSRSGGGFGFGGASSSS